MNLRKLVLRMGAPMDSITFEKITLEGLEKYMKADKTVVHFVLTKDKEDIKTDLMTVFRKLNQRIEYYYPRSKVEYCLVMVNHNHIHCLWKKPWLDFFKISEILEHILSYKPDIFLRKVGRGSIHHRKIVSYFLSQADKHNTNDVKYLRSENWGFVKKNLTDKQKEKLEKIGQVNIETMAIIPDKVKENKYVPKELSWMEKDKKRRLRAERDDLE